MNKKLLLVGLFLSLVIIAAGLVVFKMSDRVLNKIKKSKTVASVVEEYEKPVLGRLKKNFAESGIDYESSHITILAFKRERRLEVYAKNKKSEDWKKFKTYEFTGFSGKIGPKLKEGDRQIPEGVYKVESLNPNSSYHLSLRVNYPNDFDKKKGELDERKKLGGDIMIHGRAVTIGCIPIGYENIEELFVLAAKSYKAGIPVVIAPTDFRNMTNAPTFAEIDWEEELYSKIRVELQKFQ